MRNLIATFIIAALSFQATHCLAQRNEQPFITEESVAYKAIIAFNQDKKDDVEFKKAFQNLQLRVEGYDVQVIKAKKDFVSITKHGKVVYEVNVGLFREAHGKGFLVIGNDQAPKVIHSLDDLIINEDTIVDIALINLGLSQYDDAVESFE